MHDDVESFRCIGGKMEAAPYQSLPARYAAPHVQEAGLNSYQARKGWSSVIELQCQGPDLPELKTSVAKENQVIQLY